MDNRQEQKEDSSYPNNFNRPILTWVIGKIN